MLGHVCAVRFVRQSFANFREIVLTIGIVDVRSEFGALTCQMTAPAE